LGFLNILGVSLLLLIPRRRVGAGAGFDLSIGSRRRDVWRMEVHVCLPNSAEPLLLHLPRGATVEAAARMLIAVLPQLEQTLREGKFLVNSHPVQRSDELADQDKLQIATSLVERA
jgi:putative ubiquitin-RnfH superfamily antitoxin RatB of RatAB toxin-antitoxin module